MKGMNALTGRTISGFDHLVQSITQILTTGVGTRVHRRPFGSNVPDRVDAPNTESNRVRLYADVATALMRWEPRLTLTRVQFDFDDSSGIYGGRQVIVIAGTSTEGNVSVRIPVGNQGDA